MNHSVVRLFAPLLAYSILCQAAEPRDNDLAIEKVVAAGLEASRTADWKEYAELVHPESLQDFKSMWLPVLQLAIKNGPAEQADVLSLFDKGSDAKSLVAMNPKELFVSSMKGLAAQFPQAKPGVAATESKIIGTVREGEELAYVVVRSCIKDTKVTKVEVITLKRSGAEWKMMLPEVIQVTAETFKRTLSSGAVQSVPITDNAEPDK